MRIRAAESIFLALEEDIATGLLKDGERLDEATLCARFNLSRTPVREALEQLVGSGLVTKIPKRGCFVQIPSIRQLIEMFEVMSELEGLCAKLAARRINNDQLLELERANMRCYEAVGRKDSNAYYDENVSFHEQIYQACGNHFLADETRKLRRRLRVYRRLQLRVKGRLNQSYNEHQAITEALRSGNTELAAKLSTEHVRVQGERFNDMISQM